MDWQKISIERLKDYEKRQRALELIPEQLDSLNMSFTAVRAARTDGTPVKDGSGNKREDALINNIVMRQELERNLGIARSEVRITETGLAVLTEEEKTVLYKFYTNRPRNHIERLCEDLHLERSRIYELKEIALRKFTIACYGIVEL